MKSIEAKATRVIVGRIMPGEDVIDSVKELVKEYNINAGLINIIGALNKATIGFFNIDTKEYTFTTLKEDFELISCMGNVSYKDGEPIIHLHIALGRGDLSMIAGHLSQPSIVSITGEVYIYEIDKKLVRANDPQFDLSLLDL